MKKAYTNNKVLLKLLMFTGICLFCFNLCNCGIEQIEYLNEPNYSIKRPWVETLDVTPYYQPTDPLEVYFQFKTREDQESQFFQGTEIYYKIYNNLNKANSERNNLESIAISSTSSGSANKMIETYNYRPLKIRGYFSSPLIAEGPTEEGQNVYIRLTDYGEEWDYSARVLVDGQPFTDNVGEYFIPVRDNEKSFNFGRNGENDAIPKKGDSDVDISDEPTYDDNTWFVNLFAVSVGTDFGTWTQLFSEVYFAGTVVIKSDDENN